jgi:hypothetical protein
MSSSKRRGLGVEIMAEERAGESSASPHGLGPGDGLYQLTGGHIIEERGQPDLLGLPQQIGAVPSA